MANTQNKIQGGDDTVVTATLLRGKFYSYRALDGTRYTFEYNTPVEVTENLAYELEELFDVVVDSDGEEFEKELFVIDFDAEPVIDEEKQAKLERIEKRKKMREKLQERKAKMKNEDVDDEFEDNDVEPAKRKNNFRRRKRQ